MAEQCPAPGMEVKGAPEPPKGLRRGGGDLRKQILPRTLDIHTRTGHSPHRARGAGGGELTFWQTVNRAPVGAPEGARERAVKNGPQPGCGGGASPREAVPQGGRFSPGGGSTTAELPKGATPGPT